MQLLMYQQGMDENPREIDESVTTPKQVFANETTNQDKNQLSELFKYSSINE